ncbi:MAG: anaerobic ribonucleoside-triphosphate reductase activating protein [Candidatus Bipolaricaulota bacterium]|nr:anaerobic ribonucleoside-triphosphate reductase activating protein [Candidatus Bipolaricaulota bacterium]
MPARAFGKAVHLQPLSLQDFPGRLAAILFFAGCNLRCPFCYNAELVLPELYAPLAPLPYERILRDLMERRGFLDGVVLTGGEPLLSPDLEEFVKELKSAGFLVKLDTNGTQPEALARLLERGLLDYVALDLKAPFPRYAEFVGLREGEAVAAQVRASAALVRERAPDYEFRTTVAPGLGEEDLEAIAAEIRGARRYVLQLFVRPQGKRLVDETWRDRPALSEPELRALLPRLGKLVPVELRA